MYHVYDLSKNIFVLDLFRRVCDKQEKDFLREKGVVSETQSDLGKLILNIFYIFF